MVQVKQFYAEMTSAGDGDWEETMPIDDIINDFLETHLNIEVIDIKYTLGNLDNTFQPTALLIYKEIDKEL